MLEGTWSKGINLYWKHWKILSAFDRHHTATEWLLLNKDAAWYRDNLKSTKQSLSVYFLLARLWFLPVLPCLLLVLLCFLLTFPWFLTKDYEYVQTLWQKCCGNYRCILSQMQGGLTLIPLVRTWINTENTLEAVSLIVMSLLKFWHP